MIEEYYKILNIDEKATLTEIKKAYRENAKLLHPDVNKSTDAHEKFILLNEAYEYLQNIKTGKTYNSKKQSYNRPTTKHKTYEDWKKAERDKARSRAQYYAKMKYETFIQTEFYKTSVAATVIIEFIASVFALFILIGVPSIGYSINGSAGIIVSVFIILITFPFWGNLLIQNRPNFEIKELIFSFSRISKSKVFHLIIVSIINLFLVIQLGFNTLINIWSLAALFLGLIGTCYMISLKFNKKMQKLFLIIGLGPGILNLFLLINFFITSNEVIETYSFKHVLHPSKHGMQKSTQINLEENIYEDYIGIRIFLDFESMKDARTITYHFADGLLGFRVLKSYEFN